MAGLNVTHRCELTRLQKRLDRAQLLGLVCAFGLLLVCLLLLIHTVFEIWHNYQHRHGEFAGQSHSAAGGVTDSQPVDSQPVERPVVRYRTIPVPADLARPYDRN